MCGQQDVHRMQDDAISVMTITGPRPGDQGTTHVMGTPATADTAATRHWLGYKLRDISILTLSSSRLSRVLGYPEQSPNGLYQYQYLDKLACEEMK